MGNIKLKELPIVVSGIDGFKIILAYTIGLVCIVAGILLVFV